MKTKNYFLSLAIACLLLLGVNAKAQLIIYEPASNAQAGGTYTGYDLDLVTPKTAPVPTGGLTYTNGLPASTTLLANPAGTSTGLRNTWGADVKVVTGLTYANSGGTLSTSGNALNSTGNTWGAGNPSVYRFMTTDPFLNSRIGGVNNGNLGYNAAGSNVVYASLLLSTNNTSSSCQFNITGTNNLNFYLSGGNWNFRNKTLGAATVNTPIFVVVKFTFTSATTATMDAWLNPTLGASLGTATQSYTETTTSISGVKFRNGNSNLTVDEIRFGLTAADVMPVVPAPSAPTALVTSAVTNNSLTLNWTASATSGVTYEIFKNGTSIGSVGTGVTTYNVTGLTAGTVYAFTVKALKDAVYSAASTAANARTTNPGVSELLIYEPADNTVATGTGAAYTGYNLNATNPLPSANNAGNGLPATTTVLANPAGTSTGLRNAWGADIQVVNGLTYTNAGRTLTTTGNALMHTGTNFGSYPAVYRFMTTDPYTSFRSSASDQVFGWNNSFATTMYFSVLLNVNDLANVGGTTAKQFQIRTALDGNSGNSGGVLFQQNTTGSNWELFLGGTSKGVLGTAVANQTELIVGSFEFTSASSTTVKVWFNPTLGAALGTPTQQFTVALAGNIQSVGCRSGNSKLIADEFRLGLKESDVMPISSASVSTATNISDIAGLTASSSITVANNGTLTIDASKTVNSITVAPQGKLTLSSGVTLGGTLTLQSTADGTATLVDDYAVPTKTAIVEQHVTLGRNWYMSSPVTAADYSWLNRGTSVQEWNESTKAWVPVTSGTLVKGKGYVQVATSTPAPTGTTGTVSVTGTTNSGTIPVTVTRTESGLSRGFNLVGNPYPSYLKWSGLNGFITDATNDSISTSFWYRTKNTGGAYIFSTYNGSSNEVVGGTTANTLLNEYIPPMQAFWIRVNQNTAVSTHHVVINFKNNMRLHGVGDNNKFKAPRANERQRLRLQLANGTATDEALIYFDANAANSFDNYDSPKMANNSTVIPDIYTKVDTEKLVINGLNAVTDNMVLPLGFKTGTAGNLTLKVNEMSNFDNNTRIYLLDGNTETELTPATEYVFNTAVTSGNETRLSLLFRAPGASTGLENANKLQAQVYINAANQITIVAPEKSSYSIYNAVGMLVDNGRTTAKLYTANCKLQTGVYVVSLSENGKELTKRVIIK